MGTKHAFGNLFGLTTAVPLLLALVIGALVAALLIHLFASSEVNGATVASLILGIVILSVVFVFLPKLSDIESLSVSPKNLEIKIRQVEIKADKIGDNVVKFIFMAMPLQTYLNLKKIAGYGVGTVRTEQPPRFGTFEMNDGFRSQLRYLRDNGYILVNCFIGELPDRGDDLSKYVSVTSIGYEFIDLREQYIADSRRALHPR